MKLTSVKLSALSLMALTMTACTSNEEVAMPQPESNQIGFSVVSNNLTRASNSYCSTNLPAKIKVTAYNNGKNYYGDAFDEITKSEADGTVSWTGTTDRYWPRVDDDTWPGLTFFAYVKDDALSENAEATDNKIVLPTEGAKVLSPKVENFTVKENVADQIDLMYATTANRKNTGAVPLNFRHALSQVCFKAQNLDPRIKSLVINKIEINGLKSRGDYQFPTASTNVTTTTTHDATEVPTGAGAKGTWTLSEELDYTNQAFYIGGIEEGSKLNKPVTCPSIAENGKYNEPDPVNISVPEMTGDNNDQHGAVTETSNPYENALNLIPQTAKAMVAEGDGGAYFKINVTMKVSETSDVSETAEEVESLTAKDKDIIVPVDIAWEEGNRYIYTFIWEDNGHVTYQARFADFDYVEEQQTYVPQTSHQAVKMRNAVGDPNDKTYLPALYFATCNIGAESPDQYGRYFWWGDIEGHTITKTGNNISRDDQFAFNSSNSLITTCSKYFSTLQNEGYLTEGRSCDLQNEKNIENEQNVYNTNIAALSEDYDAARQRWGDNWRMPTIGELFWLANLDKTEPKHCEWKWWDGLESSDAVTFNFNGETKKCDKYVGTAGCFVMSNETGGVIFFPASGQLCNRKENEEYLSVGERCIYWSSTHASDSQAYYMSFSLYNNEIYCGWGGNQTFWGSPIRPVSNNP